jgi:hypothetical protein
MLGIVVVAAPPIQAYNLWQLRHLLGLDAWTALTAPGGDQYHPLYLPLMLAVICGGTILLCCQVALLPLFFRRHKTFPKAFLITLGSLILLGAAETFGMRAIPGALEAREARDFTDGWVRSALVAVAFMIYVGFGRRARRTFVFPLPGGADPAPQGSPSASVPESEGLPPAKENVS